MQAFDIRITGETSERADNIVAELVAKLIKGDSRVHHASLNGREVTVTVRNVEVKSNDPDGFVKKISDLAPPGGVNKGGDHTP